MAKLLEEQSFSFRLWNCFPIIYPLILRDMLALKCKQQWNKPIKEIEQWHQAHYMSFNNVEILVPSSLIAISHK